MKYLFLSIRPFLVLFSKKIRSQILWLTFLGLACSTVPLVLIMQITDSMISGITQIISQTYAYPITIHKPIIENEQQLQTDKKWLEQHPQVKTVEDEQRSYVLLGSGQGKSIAQLRGFNPQQLQKNKDFLHYFHLLSGHWSLKPGQIMLGEQLARLMGAHVGSPIVLVTLASGNGIKSLYNNDLNYKGNEDNTQKEKFKLHFAQVSGIFSIGYAQLDQTWAFMNGKWMAQMIPRQYRDDLWGIQLNSLKQSPSLVSQFQNYLGDSFWVQSAQQQDLAQNMNLMNSKILLFFVAFLVLLMCVFCVVSALVAYWMEKTQDIQTFYALGLSVFQIKIIYFYTGLFLCFFGVFFGMIVGLCMSIWINPIIGLINNSVDLFLKMKDHIQGQPYGGFQLLNSHFYLNHIPVHIYWSNLVYILAITIILSVLISFWALARIKNSFRWGRS